jgi:hypothetical protein
MRLPRTPLSFVVAAFLAASCGNPNGDTLAPETVIDGYTLGLAAPDCPLTNPECAKVLDLARTSALLTDRGRAVIASCSLTADECIRFAGHSQPDGGPARAGLGEIVGLAEDAVRAEHPGIDPRAILGFRQYAESHTAWIGPNGEVLQARSGGYSIIVFRFADGSVHAAGVGCPLEQCQATR